MARSLRGCKTTRIFNESNGFEERLRNINIEVKNEVDGTETICAKFEGSIKTLEMAFLIMDSWGDEGNIVQLEKESPRKVLVQLVNFVYSRSQ